MVDILLDLGIQSSKDWKCEVITWFSCIITPKIHFVTHVPRSSSASILAKIQSLEAGDHNKTNERLKDFAERYEQNNMI